jgi:hypothetical protein
VLESKLGLKQVLFIFVLDKFVMNNKITEKDKHIYFIGRAEVKDPLFRGKHNN